MKRWTLVLVGAFALALWADMVTAAEPPGRGQRPGRPGERERPGPGFRRFVMPLMAALDADEDGELSAEEIKNAVAALKKLDKNGNGKLERDELRPQFGPPRRPGEGPPGRPAGQSFVERIMGFDENKDGKVSKEEMPERMRRIFDRIDADGDGAITEAEAKKFAAQFSRGDRPPRRPGGPGGERPERPPRTQPPREE